MHQTKLMPQVRDNIIYLMAAFVFIIYMAFFMGEQSTWWSKATILLCIVIAILNIILIIQSLVAWYDAVESDSRVYRIRNLEDKVRHLESQKDDLTLKITDGRTDVIPKAILREIIKDKYSGASYGTIVEKIVREINKSSS